MKMRVFAATVRGGAIVADEAAALGDGTSVTVIADDEDGFEVGPEAEAELVAALAEADRGELVPAGDVIRRLRR